MQEPESLSPLSPEFVDQMVPRKRPESKTQTIKEAGMEMGEFIKKPVRIKAFRANQPMVINTLEGDMRAEAGDWIITGVAGEIYPCKDEIFRQTYNPYDKTAHELWSKEGEE